ncbi:hypothetical protein BCR43DRAFT_499769 [Syncephalastrum racemosum]|uniref:Uncharacterized protein n=1 Tax=Syncephalastrum racemosum TaxID=13706 RepID=A0A1X2H0S4_SYNRA|nr:hypothetical protein BCR43DRAFT_499769 [Syncephalastrum racemosum]
MVSIEKIGRRISQSKWTKVYIALALLQGIMIIALQAGIASQNTTQAGVLPQSIPSQFNSTQTTLASDVQDAIHQATNRLDRIKWENVAFIGFQIWFVGMAFDATVYQNAAEVIALAMLNVICAVLGGLEVMDGRRWLKYLRQVNADYDLSLTTTPLQIAYYLEIALTTLLAVFAVVFAYVSYMVVREFGWVIYKKIGPDVSIQKMYRIFQFFVLALKIDIFIEFLVSIFYFIQFAIDSGFQWDTWVMLVVTILMLPMLYFARATVAAEAHGRMLVFIIFQFVVVFEFILVLRQTLTPNNYWYTWICFVVLGMIFALGTSVLGAWCMSNFGKGLAPYVQRGANKEQAGRHELKGQASVSSWRIDDD